MENIRKSLDKLKPQNEEEEIKQKRLIAYGAIPNLITSIVMVTFGGLYNNDEDCPGKEATQFLMVGGSVLAASCVIKLYYLTKIEKLHKFANTFYPLLDLTYFCLIIWGSVKVFGKLHSFTIVIRNFEMCCVTGVYDDWTSEDSTSPNYCVNSAFMMAFVTLIVYWIIMPLSICGYCFYHICCKK